MLKKIFSFCALTTLTLIFNYQSSLAFDYNSKINWAEKLLALEEPCPFQEAFNFYQAKGFISSKTLCNEHITKLDFLVLGMKAKGIILPQSFQFSQFKDIKNNDTTAPYAQKALELNIIPLEKLFYPNQNLIKIKALETLFNIHDIQLEELPDNFQLKDVPHNSWYTKIVFTNYVKNIIKNRSDEYFWPFDTVTYGMASEMNKNINQIVLVKKVTPSKKQQEVDSYLNFYANIWDIIENNYLWEEDISREEMINQSIKWLVASLDDPHSNFYTPEENKAFRENLKGEIVGIGILITETTDNYLLIDEIIPDWPAEKAWLQVGDIIIAVDDQDLASLSLTESINKIKGKVDTAVKITYQRVEQIFNKTIIRKKVSQPNIELKKLDNNIIYLKIRKFTEDLTTEFIDIAEEIKFSNPKNLILDLRNNPGGYLDTSVKLASYFLEKNDIIVQTIDKKNNTEIYYADFGKTITKGSLTNIPVTILVNHQSASASEILALALKENINAQIIGEQTYGKGSAQVIYTFENNSSLKLTIMEWISPLGNHINGIGITPNILINDDFTTKKDDILEKALENIK